MKLTTAQALIRFLDAQYVRLDGKEYKFVHGVAGIFGHGCVLGIGEALAETQNQLRFYRVQNEQGAGHMAIGFAKQHNRLGFLACTSSIGPGAMNMVTAAATATANRIPVLFLPGDIFANRQPDPVLQQVEQEYDHSLSSNDAFRAVSKYWDRISRPEQLMSACLHAMRTLSDPALCGAVTLSLPQDVAAEAYDYPEPFFARRVHEIQRRPLAPGMAEQIAQRIQGKKRPAILVGGGARYSFATEEIIALAEQCRIPLMETQSGKGQIAWHHPLNLGPVGTTGTLAANRIAKDVDCLIALGTRLNDFHTASKWAFRNPELQVIGINVNGMDAYKLDALPALADVRLALEELRGHLSGYRSSYAADEIAAIRREWNAEVERLYHLPCGLPLRDAFSGAAENSNVLGSLMQTRVLGLMRELLPQDAVVVCSGGSLPSDLERIWRCETPGSYHLEYAYSCMGYEIPGAIGAKLAEPQREVWVLIGDGTYLMYHQELLTAIAENLKINVMLLDNGGWQCIDNLQTSQGIRRFGCERRSRGPGGELDGPYLPVDFAQNAQSYGCLGLNAASETELRWAIGQARSSEKTAVIAARCVVKSMTEGYESWWNAGTPEVSQSEKVLEAYREMEQYRREARRY
ncbi:MAG: 3D-(3,5/4)-trihydroxycyclohexane-1,2-dione acylhydrolase (decyclizing) [Spirochaetota bacterium]